MTMILAVLLAGAPAADPIVGEWRGTSLCQVRPSPCHDEQAVYRIERTPAGYRMHFAKVVNGQPEEFGASPARYDPASATLTVTGQDPRGRPFTWRFVRRGAHLSGTLSLDDGTIYRRAEVDRVGA